jgi:hypothetical protein
MAAIATTSARISSCVEMPIDITPPLFDDQRTASPFEILDFAMACMPE